MSNTLATLNGLLATQLRDTSYATWTSAEMDGILTQVVARLYPHVAQRLDPTANTLTLVADTYFYNAPAGVIEVERLGMVDSSGYEYGFLDGQSWHTVGDSFSGGLQVYISPLIVDNYSGNTIRVYGYGRFDTATNLIPDDYVDLVLAMARAEAYGRLAADREQFLQWQASEQEQNVSVNELLQMIHEAKIERESLWSRYSTQRRPVPGRMSY